MFVNIRCRIYSLYSSQVPAPGCNLRWGSTARPFQLGCRTHCHCHLVTKEVARVWSMLSASHLSYSGTLLMFAELVLIASPCSVTTTASDDEFSMPTNTPGWNRGSDLAGMYRIFSPNSRIGVLSLPPVWSLQRCLSVPADVAPVHQVCRKLHQPAQSPCVGRDSGPYALLQCSLHCPGLACNEPHRTLNDPVGLTFSLWHSLTPFLAGVCNLSRRCFNCRPPCRT